MICGDFNIDLFSSNPHSRRLIQICDDNGLDQLIKSPTRIFTESATLIDLCLSNINENLISSTVSIEDQISDHAILQITVRGKNNTIPMKSREYHIWKNYDKACLWQSIENSIDSWELIKNCDVNMKTEWLLSIISDATIKFKTLKRMCIKDDFFNHELEQMRVEKNRLYKIAQYSNGSIDSQSNWINFKVFKNEYKKAIQIKKFECNQRKLNRVTGDAKGTWRVLNAILEKECCEIIRIKNGSSEMDNDMEIANSFNKFFVDSITQLNNSIPLHRFEADIQVNQNISFRFRPVSISEIKSNLKELKNNTDEFFIKPSVLLDAVFVIGVHIANIINESFETGIFPSILKKSTIIPIQKKAGSINIEDHRPINMLPCLERLIESLAYSQFNNFISTNKLISSNQSGFRAKHSCETAINDVLTEWREAQNNSKIIIAVFLDFQRAFETIDPDLMIIKLSQYGVLDSSLEWFKSYLNNRKQIVKLGESKSNEVFNNLGVPQGSILGPLLFSLYINDIQKCLKFASTKMFADDTLVYVTSDSIDDAVQKLNEDLEILFRKLCQNKLKLNVNKTKVMVISNKTLNHNNINIAINNQKLEIENEIKYLGVMIDDKLKFDKNTNCLCKKLGQKVNTLNRLRNDLNHQQKLTIYKAIILPHFTYCATILFLAKDSDIDRLQKLQNKCVRHISNLNHLRNCQDILQTLDLMNVKQIIFFRTLIFIYKIINNQVPEYLSCNIHYNHENQSRELRSSNNLKLANATKSCSQNSIFYKGIKLYNSLPMTIKQAETLNLFQKLLKTHVLENY